MYYMESNGYVPFPQSGVTSSLGAGEWSSFHSAQVRGVLGLWQEKRRTRGFPGSLLVL